MRRAFTLVRHGMSSYNVEGILNGDPSVPVYLTDEGRAQSGRARDVLTHEVFDLGVHTEFPRTRETLMIVLDGRVPPIEVFPELNDQSLGDMEGRPMGEYREFRAKYGIGAPPPGGESRLDALARLTRGYERLLATDAAHPLVVTHDLTIRCLANAAQGEDPITGAIRHVPNASVTRLSEPELRAGIAVMKERSARG